MAKTLAALGLMLALAAVAAASPLLGPRVRADDGTLWNLEDNPAFMTVDTGLFMGVAYDGMDSLGQGLAEGSYGKAHVAGLLPFVGYYRLSFGDSDFDLVTGQAFSLGRSLALGYDFLYSSATDKVTSYGLGLLIRPSGYLSLGLTGDYAVGSGYSAGLGLALRPLSLFGVSGSASRALSLTADGAWSTAEGFFLEGFGAQLSLPGSLSLRASYSFPTTASPEAKLGLGLRLSLGPLGLYAMSPALLATTPGYRMAEDLRLDLSTLKKSSLGTASSLGKTILVVKDLDAVTSVPLDSGSYSSLFSSSDTMAFTDLLALVEEARKDPAIVALALENLPSLGGGADYEEFLKALAGLRAAGKKVYLYGEAFGNEFAYLASQADEVVLNPLGSVDIQGFSYRRAYLKTFFAALGISFVNLAPWETKSAFNSYTEDSMPPGEAAMMRRLYGDYQSMLLGYLGSGRGGKLKAEPAAVLGAGPYLLADQALAAGLVDRLAYAGDFEARLKSLHPGATLASTLPETPGSDWGGPAFAKRAAVVWLSGSIGTGKGTKGQDIGRTAATALETLRKSPLVSGIVLRVDSPGGAVLTSDLIAREVRLAVEAGKPVVVSMGRYAASGGYYVSAPASWILADPSTLTGSIGVTGLVPNASEALRKLGINYDGFELSKGSGFLDPLKPGRPEDEAKLKAMILATYDRFVGVVASGRRMDEARVRKLAEGQVYTGREALALGLVDELGGLAQAKAWLQKKLGASLYFVDVVPGEAPGLLSSFGGLAKTLGLGQASGLESLVSPLARAAQSLVDLGGGPLYYLDVDSLGF